MLHETFFGLKLAASFLVGLTLLGAVFWKQMGDATNSLLLAIALAELSVRLRRGRCGATEKEGLRDFVQV